MASTKTQATQATKATGSKGNAVLTAGMAGYKPPVNPGAFSTVAPAPQFLTPPIAQGKAGHVPLAQRGFNKGGGHRLRFVMFFMYHGGITLHHTSLYNMVFGGGAFAAVAAGKQLPADCKARGWYKTSVGTGTICPTSQKAVSQWHGYPTATVKARHAIPATPYMPGFGPNGLITGTGGMVNITNAN